MGDDEYVNYSDYFVAILLWAKYRTPFSCGHLNCEYIVQEHGTWMSVLILDEWIYGWLSLIIVLEKETKVD